MDKPTNHDTKEWIRKYSRFGMAAKGVVYILTGLLTALAAFNAGGKTTGKGGAFEFVMHQPFGKILLGLIALGLIGYVVWRAAQAIKDPEDEGNMRRIGYVASGVFYALIAATAITMIISGGSGGSSSGSGSNEQMAGKLLQQAWGQYLVGAVALILFGKAIWQFYRAISGKFNDKIKSMDLNSKVEKLIKNFGLVGYISRGIVISLIGYMFLKAALQVDSSEAGGTKEAFSLIRQSEAGPYVLGIIALGLAAYGIFMFVKARHRIMPSL